jgi:putative transposase
MGGQELMPKKKRVWYFNNKYNFIGHLFQGRYKAEIIEKDAYNLQTSRYIHLNPVKASMVELPEEYQWSSYDIYMGQRQSDLVTDEKILSYFKENSRKLYREYVESEIINQIEINTKLEAV